MGQKRILYRDPSRNVIQKEFIDASDKLSLSVLDEEYRKTLSYLGSVSGRDEDKIAKSGLTVASTRTMFRILPEANTVITGKTLCTGIQTRMLYRFIS